MATNKRAQIEKEKGNTAFQARDYPTAIGHYTSAILADRSDYTFPLNRAAAYLKLGKNEDAERDCTTVLNLNAYNVKALFRRAQARVGMGNLDEALSDLTQASKREPANEPVKEELNRVSQLLQVRKNQTPRIEAEAPISTPTTKRRRVPIKIIDPSESNSAPKSSTQEAQINPRSHQLQPSVIPEKSQGSNDSLTHVSTRSLKSAQLSSPTQPPKIQARSPAESSKPSMTAQSHSEPVPSPSPSAKPDQPRSFKEAKLVRETGKPSRVGGGIFRASGENTVFPTRNGANIDPTPLQNESLVGSGSTHTRSLKAKGGNVRALWPAKSPTTLFDFIRALDSASSLEERWGLVLSIPPAKISTLFKTSLEPAVLIKIMSVLREVLTESEDVQEIVTGYMDAFATVQRFDTVMMLLSREEKAVVRDCWKALGRGKEDLGKAWKSIWG